MANWRDSIPIHPAADLFPMMTADELRALGEDINKHGMRNPIAIWSPPDESDKREFLLDGRNRLDAAELLGLLAIDDHGRLCLRKLGELFEIQRKFYCDRRGSLHDADPYALAVSLNIHRRHLTAEQKRDLIAKLLKANPERSNRQTAKIVGVSHPHVAAVRGELEKSGDVVTVTTSIDTKGRKQPASRPRVKPNPPRGFDAIASVQPTIERGALILEENQRRGRSLGEVAVPEVLEDNILHAIGGINENARVFNKLLKVSALDREAVARINTAIDGMIGKWRSIQSMLEKKGKAEAPPTAPDQPDGATTLEWVGVVPCGSSPDDNHSNRCAPAPGGTYIAMVVRKDGGVFSHYSVSFVVDDKKSGKFKYLGSAKSLETAKEIARQHGDTAKAAAA